MIISNLKQIENLVGLMSPSDGVEAPAPSIPIRPLILKIFVVALFAYGVWQVLGFFLKTISGQFFDPLFFAIGMFSILISWGLWKGNPVARIIAFLAVLGGMVLAVLAIVSIPVISIILLTILAFSLLVLAWPSVSVFFAHKEGA